MGRHTTIRITPEQSAYLGYYAGKNGIIGKQAAIDSIINSLIENDQEWAKVWGEIAEKITLGKKRE